MKFKIFGFNAKRLIENDPYYKTEVDLVKNLNKRFTFINLSRIVFGSDSQGRPNDYLTEREEKIVASVIQWLGTPVGKHFLAECGFKYKGE